MRKRLGEILLEQGILTRPQLEQALAENTGGRLGEALVKLGFVTPEQLARVMAEQFHLPFVALRDVSFDPEAVRLFSARTARRYKVVPIAREGKKLKIATSDPLNVVAIDDISLITGLTLEITVMSTTDLDRALARLYPEAQVGDGKATTPTNAADAAPVVHLVNHLIAQAVKERASDIHLEPGEEGVRVRFRIDGLLQDITRLDKELSLAVVSRVKIMAGLDISEKRLPQDGSLRFTELKDPLDLRLSSLPTVLGEKLVIRLLKSGSTKLSLAEIGLTEEPRRQLEAMLQSAYGMVLVTGPTGSGKTTTLYSALGLLHNPQRNIVTVEDPVEFRVPGINQVAVNARIGLGFAQVLRALVRQDPDIIMVGEIRDSETADIAIRSALTGHFVLSSLHTNDAPSTITRLVDMGVEPFLVASSLLGIVAQRLVRRLCPHCKMLAPLPAGSPQLTALGLDPKTEHPFFGPKGCEYCNGEGYRGRIGIFEVLPINEELRERIAARATAGVLRALAAGMGIRSFRQDGLEKARQGFTTVSEVLRMSYQEG
ncbi:MAG: putative type II secretion system protein HxcR [Firmicutes bacterium]|nr:putative type II secretion system protein HxcR [Bacillota bacterium]